MQKYFPIRVMKSFLRTNAERLQKILPRDQAQPLFNYRSTELDNSTTIKLIEQLVTSRPCNLSIVRGYWKDEIKRQKSRAICLYTSVLNIT